MLVVTCLLVAAPAATAETRTLKLYFLHTRERAEITYKRNGRYIQSGLNEINRFLRDWRRNEPTKMDPQLLDLLWEVYRASGSRDYIHVVSAYRAPETNAMLRKRSNGVAKKSQHMLGKAIDFYLPDVKLVKLRNIGLKMQVGGVGYYPRSGSPFVHLDVGSVRHWPRMSRGELASVFPDGKTLHIPTDGKPLPGYEQALASYEARQRRGGTIQIASDSGGGGRSGNRGRGLLAALFGGGADEEEDNAETQVAAAPQRPAQTAQPSVQRPQAEEPEKPATILAALPERILPVPRIAPRPDVEVGTPLAVEAAPAAGTPAATEDNAPAAQPVEVAANIPVPTRRPDYTPPAEPAQVAEAEDVKPLVMASASAYVTPTRRPEPPRSVDAIAEILAAQKDQPVQDEAVGVVPAYLPLPAADRDAEPKYTVAALASGKEPSSLADSEDDVSAAAAMPAEPLTHGRPVAASPRLALLKSHGGSTAAAIVAGSVKTTPKGPKPRAQDARTQPKPMVLPVKATTAALVLSRQSVLDTAGQGKKPAFSMAFAEAPKAVYTDGFKKELDVADARRFTGRAVTFLSVAKFE